jgi:hypothetical protein
MVDVRLNAEAAARPEAVARLGVDLPRVPNSWVPADVLAKGCSVDLHPRVCHRGISVQTMLGRADVVLLALSDAGDDYLVLVRSSFAGYLADWLLDAALEFIVPTSAGRCSAADTRCFSSSIWIRRLALRSDSSVSAAAAR